MKMVNEDAVNVALGMLAGASNYITVNYSGLEQQKSRGSRPSDDKLTNFTLISDKMSNIFHLHLLLLSLKIIK